MGKNFESSSLQMQEELHNRQRQVEKMQASLQDAERRCLEDRAVVTEVTMTGGTEAVEPTMAEVSLTLAMTTDRPP